MVKKHLDRVIFSGNWLEIFPMASNQHLRSEELDHCPILLRQKGKENKTNRPFQFFQTWLTDNTCNSVINKAWKEDDNRGMHNYRLTKSLDYTSKALKKWNRDCSSYVHKQIKALETELEEIQILDIQPERQA